MSLYNTVDGKTWEGLSYEEKNRKLFLEEKELLDTFLEHGAITKAQHDKSLHDLIVKMGVINENGILDTEDTSVSGR